MTRKGERCRLSSPRPWANDEMKVRRRRLELLPLLANDKAEVLHRLELPSLPGDGGMEDVSSPNMPHLSGRGGVAGWRCLVWRRIWRRMTGEAGAAVIIKKGQKGRAG